MKSNNNQIIGIDLGHGETASAIVPLNGHAGARTLRINGMPSQITAFGTTPKGVVVIGTAAAHNRMVTDLRLGFKIHPPGTEKSRADLTSFLREYLRTLIKSHQIEAKQGHYYFVGHPSGWNKQAVADYQNLLATVLDPVHMVPESRAVLAFASADGLISEENKTSPILVIDLGSSTTDITFLSGGVTTKSFDGGEELGSHLIDEEILQRAIQNSSKSKEIKDYLAKSEESLRRALLTLCREAKESYWNDEDGYGETGHPIHLSVCPERDLFINWSINHYHMNLILREPLKKLGKGWLDAFSDLLERTRSSAALQAAAPELILLSGGPSHMSIIRDICQKHFPEAQLKWCTPPCEAVAKGLASWGKIFLNTTKFSQVIDKFCSATLNKIVSDNIPQMAQDIADKMTDRLIDEVIKPSLLDWRRRDIRTLETLESTISDRTSAWILSKATQKSVHEACKNSLHKISKMVNLSTQEICVNFGIPHAALFLDLTVPVKSEDWAIGSVNPFDSTLGVAGGITFTAAIALTAIAKGFLATATLATGPPGWLVLGLLTTWAAIFGLMAAEEKLRSADLPVPIRQTFLSDSKVSKLLKEAHSQLRKQIMEALGEREQKDMCDAISIQVSEFLHARADEVRWIIS